MQVHCTAKTQHQADGEQQRGECLGGQGEVALCTGRKRSGLHLGVIQRSSNQTTAGVLSVQPGGGLWLCLWLVQSCPCVDQQIQNVGVKLLISLSFDDEAGCWSKAVCRKPAPSSVQEAHSHLFTIVYSFTIHHQIYIQAFSAIFSTPVSDLWHSYTTHKSENIQNVRHR